MKQRIHCISLIVAIITAKHLHCVYLLLYRSSSFERHQQRKREEARNGGGDRRKPEDDDKRREGKKEGSPGRQNGAQENGSKGGDDK